jgi:hypothetical protein
MPYSSVVCFLRALHQISSSFFRPFHRVRLLRCLSSNLARMCVYWPHIAADARIGPRMPIFRDCLSCHKSFIPEARSQASQRYCRKITCQRARRARSQRQRRLDRSPPTLAATGAKARSRLLNPTEVDWLANHPLFVGHLSQILGSQHADDVREYMLQLIQRGLDILSTPKSGKYWKPLLAGQIQKPSRYLRRKR